MKRALSTTGRRQSLPRLLRIEGPMRGCCQVTIIPSCVRGDRWQLSARFHSIPTTDEGSAVREVDTALEPRESIPRESNKQFSKHLSDNTTARAFFYLMFDQPSTAFWDEARNHKYAEIPVLRLSDAGGKLNISEIVIFSADLVWMIRFDSSSS